MHVTVKYLGLSFKSTVLGDYQINHLAIYFIAQSRLRVDKSMIWFVRKLTSKHLKNSLSWLQQSVTVLASSC